MPTHSTASKLVFMRFKVGWVGVWREVCGGRYVGGVVLNYTCVSAFTKCKGPTIMNSNILYLQVETYVYYLE